MRFLEQFQYNQSNWSHLQIMISGPLPDPQNLHNYRLIKDQVQLPLKIHLYFTFLEAALQNDSPTKTSSPSQAISPLFYSIFRHLSAPEKAHYLHSNISFLKKQYDKGKTGLRQDSNHGKTGNNFSASGQLSESLMGLTYWNHVRINFTFESKQVKLQTKSKNISIDLRLYLIRKSKKYKSTLVLEAISEIVTAADRKLSLFFKETIFSQIYEELLSCILTYRNYELFKIALEQSVPQNQRSTELSYISSKSKSLSFLSSKNINDFLNFKEFVFKKLLHSGFSFQHLFTDHTCKIGFDRNRARKNFVYKMEASFEMPADSLKKKFLEKYRSQNFKHIIQSQELQNFSQKYCAVYQKFLFRKFHGYHEIQQIIVEQINDKDALHGSQQLIFQKGVNNLNLNSLIQFLVVKVKGQDTPNRSKLIVIASFNKISNPDEVHESNRIVDIQESQQIIVMFLLEFCEMVSRKEVETEEIQRILHELRSFDDVSARMEKQSVVANDFVTVEGNFAYNGKEEFVIDTDDLETVQGDEDNAIGNKRESQQQNMKKVKNVGLKSANKTSF